MVRKQIQFYLSKEVIKKLNRRAPKGQRSKLLERILSDEFERLKKQYGKHYLRNISKILTLEAEEVKDFECF